MSTKAFKIIATLSLFLALAAVSAQAQSRGKIEAQIPFDFIVGDVTLPAGNYSVKLISRNNDKALLIRSEKGRASAMVLTNAVEAGAEQSGSKLVFHRYGDKYFLSQVWTQGVNTGRELYRSSDERRLANEPAEAEMKPQRIEIAARTR